MPRYEIGDVLICKSGFNKGDHQQENRGGCGYAEGRIGTVKSISSKTSLNPIYWFEEFDNGVFEHALERVDPTYKPPKYTIWR